MTFQLSLSYSLAEEYVATVDLAVKTIERASFDEKDVVRDEWRAVLGELERGIGSREFGTHALLNARAKFFSCSAEVNCLYWNQFYGGNL